MQYRVLVLYSILYWIIFCLLFYSISYSLFYSYSFNYSILHVPLRSNAGIRTYRVVGSRSRMYYSWYYYSITWLASVLSYVYNSPQGHTDRDQLDSDKHPGPLYIVVLPEYCTLTLSSGLNDHYILHPTMAPEFGHQISISFKSTSTEFSRIILPLLSVFVLSTFRSTSHVSVRSTYSIVPAWSLYPGPSIHPEQIRIPRSSYL